MPYSKIGILAIAWSVAMCYVGCSRGVRAPRSAVWGAAGGVLPPRHVFKPKCAYFQIRILYSNWKSHASAISYYMLHWLCMRCSCPLLYRLGAARGVRPGRMFSSLSVSIFKLISRDCVTSFYVLRWTPTRCSCHLRFYLVAASGAPQGARFQARVPIFKFVSYPQTKSPTAVRLVVMCYFGHIRDVHATHGVVWGQSAVSTRPSRHIFNPKCVYFEIRVLFSNRESRNCTAGWYILYWTCMRCSFPSRCRLRAVAGFRPLVACSSLSVSVFKFMSHSQIESSTTVGPIATYYIGRTPGVCATRIYVWGALGVLAPRNTFSSLSVHVFKFVSYPQTGSPATTRLVAMCYVGHARGVHAPRDAIKGRWGCPPQHVFKPKCDSFQICVLSLNWEFSNCMASCYVLC